MNVALELVSSMLIILGSVFCLIGAWGLIRMPSFITRVHSASLIDSLGAILIISGLVIHAGFTLTALKLVMILIFLLITGPTAVHALVNTAFHEDRHHITGKEESSST